jgi:hypothetical protein
MGDFVAAAGVFGLFAGRGPAASDSNRTCEARGYELDGSTFSLSLRTLGSLIPDGGAILALPY